MTHVGLLSDTHAFLHPKIYDFFRDCHQIWHAGDIGSIALADQLNAFKPLTAVYGNIDDHLLRLSYPETQLFYSEEVKVLMTHIGGYPGKYTFSAKEIIEKERPDLFITGHSHILKVMYDQKNQLLHINPGAAGKSGFHQIITLIRFQIDGKNINDLEILELNK
ncbi:MAG: metallophosphoesterase family protein [Bacteroidales bacterium]